MIKLTGKGYRLERFKSVQHVQRRLFNKPSPKLFSHVGGRSCSKNVQASLLIYIQAQVVLNSGALSLSTGETISVVLKKKKKYARLSCSAIFQEVFHYTRVLPRNILPVQTVFNYGILKSACLRRNFSFESVRIMVS